MGPAHDQEVRWAVGEYLATDPVHPLGHSRFDRCTPSGAERHSERGDLQVSIPSGINIVGRSNRVGLDRDASLIAEIVGEAGRQVSFSHYRSRPWGASLLPSRTTIEATVFLERVFPRWFGTSAVNLLIPNQERFPRRHVRRLDRVDHVLCKTRHAQAIFRGLGCSVFYIGFTSRDRYDQNVTRDYRSAFHLAGRSTLKGTEAVLRLWRKHPEWPELLVVQHRKHGLDGLPDNIRLLHTYLGDEELRDLQNRRGIHLCPSRAEGWGHALVEGLSCKALVVTTDAPPMNEVVDSGRGICVPFATSSPRNLGTSFEVDEVALEHSVQILLDLPIEESQRLGTRAREWFLRNDSRFRARLPEVIDQVVSSRSER